MADRSVNININYKVNTADIDKAKAASKAAQAATDNLRKATKDYGTTGAKAGKEAADAVKKVSDSTKTAATDTNNLSKEFGNLITSVKAFITLAAVKQLAGMGIEAVRLAGNVEGVQRAFDRAFPNSVKVLNDLRTATKGTITDFELMQRTLQATNLGVAVEKLPILFEFAAARAQQTGESVDYLVDSIVRGIGRKSLLILDNLGLSATRLKEQFHGASLASQSVADVTAGVAAIAKVELDKMGGYVETGATRVAQLEAAWEKLKLSLAQRIEGSVSINFFTDVLKDLSNLITGEKELGEQEAKNRASREADTIIQSEAYQSLGDNTEGRIKLLSLEIVKQVELINARKAEVKILDQIIAAQDESTMQGGISIEMLKKQKKQQEGGITTYEETIEVLKKYLIELRKVNEEEGVEEQLGIIGRKKEEIKALQDQLDRTNKSGDVGFTGKLIESLKKAQKELEILLGAESDEQKKLTDYLAYLSEQEMFQTKEMLKEKIKQRKDETEEEIRIEKEKQAAILKAEKEAAEESARIEKHKQELIREARQTTINGAIDTAVNLSTSIIQQEADEYNKRIAQLDDFYDKQVDLAGDNEREKAKIEKKREIEIDKARKEAFRKNKEAQKLTAIINGAGAAARAFVDYQYPVSIAIAALAAAQAGAQVAIINRQNFKDGVINLKGPGTATSDSIPANLSRGESVMTAAETIKAKGVLEMIRGNKLDDNILKQLQISNTGVRYVGMTDERIVKAIKENKHPDLIKINNDFHEVKKSRDGISKTIRRKSITNG